MPFAAATTGAQPSDGEMPQFAPHAVGSPQEPPGTDHSSPDARSQREHHVVSKPPGGASKALSQGVAVGVVLQADRGLEPLFQKVPERKAAPSRKVRSPKKVFPGGVNYARKSYAYRSS